ncbi:MAG: hypothetical protein Q9228_003207 [Teloschistes exilis]
MSTSTAVNAGSMARKFDVDGRATSSATTAGSEDSLSFHTPMSTPENIFRRLSPSEVSLVDISDEFDKLDRSITDSITRSDAAETSQYSVQDSPSSKNSLPLDAKGTIDAPFEYLSHEQTQEGLSEEMPSPGAGISTAGLKMVNSELTGNAFYLPRETVERLNAPHNSPGTTNERERHNSYLGAINNEAYSSPHSFWNHHLADTKPVTFSDNSLPIKNEKSIIKPFNDQTTIRTTETSKDLTDVTEEEKRHAHYVKTFHGHPSRKFPVVCGHSRGVPKKKVVTPREKYRKSKKEANVFLKTEKDEAYDVDVSRRFGEVDLQAASEIGTMKNWRWAVDHNSMTPGLDSSRRRLRLVRMDAILGTSKDRAHQLGSSNGSVSPGQDDERGDDKPKHRYKVVEHSVVKDPGVDTTAIEHAAGSCVAGPGHLAEHTIGHADPNHDGESLFSHPFDIPWMGYNQDEADT